MIVLTHDWCAIFTAEKLLEIVAFKERKATYDFIGSYRSTLSVAQLRRFHAPYD
jgi:hypothetical protein